VTEAVCLNQEAKEEKIQPIIFYTTVHNKCCQPSELLQYNTKRYGSYAQRCSKQQAACWYRLLTAGQNIGTAPFICFAVTSRVLPSKEHKINKRTCNV
jgi:hypothetical protein